MRRDVSFAMPTIFTSLILRSFSSLKSLSVNLGFSSSSLIDSFLTRRLSFLKKVFFGKLNLIYRTDNLKVKLFLFLFEANDSNLGDHAQSRVIRRIFAILATKRRPSKLSFVRNHVLFVLISFII